MSRRKNRPRKEYKNDWKHEIKVEQDYICPVCGQKGTEWSLNIHHCIAKSKGGKNTKENCVAWHETPCHRNYHRKHGTRTSDKHGNPI